MYVYEKGGHLSRGGRAQGAEPSPDPAVGAEVLGVDAVRPDGRGGPARPADPTLVVGLEPEDEALLPQQDDNTRPRVAPPVIDIPRPNLDDLEPPELRGIVGLNPRNAQQTILREKEIKAIEKEYKISLGPEEKQLILNRRLGARLSGIDASTDAILGTHYARLFSSDTRKARINKRRIEKIGTTAATIGASIGLRMALHALGFTIGAGTITGAVVGGLAGRYRAGKAEREKQHGLSGVQEQFNKIKSNSNDPRAESNALAFLSSYLKSDRFKGNVGDYLKLVVLYQGTASHLIGDRDQHIGLAPIERANMTDTLKEFDTAANEACNEAATKGMWNGMWKGAAFGAISDVVGGLIHHWRVEHFKDVYLQEHAGYNNTFHGSYSNLNASAADIPQDPHFGALNSGHGLDLQATPYGNTLSSTIHDGLQNGQLHVPDTYIQQMTHEINPVTGQLFTSQEATGQFVYNFNFAQVPNVGDHWNHGGVILMNKDGVQELMNRAVQASSGHWNIDPTTNIKTWIPEIDYQKFAETLKTGGTLLETQYPADYGVLHSTSNALMNKAMEEAQRLAAEPLAESVVMGAGIGLMTDRTTTAQANKISGAGDKDSGRGAQGAGAAGETTEEQQRAVRPTTPAPTAAVAEATPAAAVVGETPPLEPPRPEPEPVEQTDWESLLFENYERFISVANDLLKEFRDKAWADIETEKKKRITSLINTVCQYNAKGLRFKIALSDAYTGRAVKYNISDPIADDSIGLAVTNIETGTTGFLGFATAGAKFNLSLMERTPDGPPENIPAARIGTFQGKFDYGYLAEIIGANRRDGKDATILINNKQALFDGDNPGANNFRTTLEILSLNPDAREFVVRTKDGQTRTIKEEKFNRIDSYDIYEWNRVGANDEYRDL